MKNTLNLDTDCNSCDRRPLYCVNLYSPDFNVLVLEDIVNSIAVILSVSKITLLGGSVVSICDAIVLQFVTGTINHKSCWMFSIF